MHPSRPQRSKNSSTKASSADNGTQFECDEFKEFCDDLQIKKVFSSVAQPHANGQVEAVNKMIKHNLKMKLKN